MELDNDMDIVNLRLDIQIMSLLDGEDDDGFFINETWRKSKLCFCWAKKVMLFSLSVVGYFPQVGCTIYS